jgi:hypothetical protein
VTARDIGDLEAVPAEDGPGAQHDPSLSNAHECPSEERSFRPRLRNEPTTGKGSVVWVADLLPDSLAQVTGELMERGIDTVKQTLEGQAAAL